MVENVQSAVSAAAANLGKAAVIAGSSFLLASVRDGDALFEPSAMVVVQLMSFNVADLYLDLRVRLWRGAGRPGTDIR